MLDYVALITIAIFLAAGAVKGVVGLGLPTISMGLLATIMPTPQAAAILIIPSLVTNLLQAVVGPALVRVAKKTAVMLAGVCVGTWSGAGLMSGPYAQHGTIFLGAALTAYGLFGLASVPFRVPHGAQRWLSPVVGLATGVITAATGVFVIPAVPYLQAIGLNKDELIQALGLSFSVSTLALAVNLGTLGLFGASSLWLSLAGLASAMLGMWGGQVLREHLQPDVFRRVFFMALGLLGLYLVFRSW